MMLEVKNLKVQRSDSKLLVKGIDFSIDTGEWFALIGESGSGKSISAFSLGGLLPAGLFRTADSLRFNDMDLCMLREEQHRKLRGKEIAYIFQEYQGAFTPYFRLGVQMDEAIQVHLEYSFTKRYEMIINALSEVGLDGEEVYKRYPFQVSGGQLQRAALAFALILKPTLLIADEPTTALDAMNASLVLDIIAKLQKGADGKKCSVLFITHDLRWVKKYADRIAIMKSGEIVETGSKDDVLKSPKRPYTQNLLAAIPPLHGVPRRLPVPMEEV